MSKNEFWKVVLASCLLFLMTYTSLLFKTFEFVPYEWVYRHYNYVTDLFEWNTLTPWKEPIRWFVMRVSNRTSLFILAIVWLINPDFSRWGNSIKIMWIVYFALLVYSFESSYNTMPFRQHLEFSIMSIQAFYTIYCFDLWNIQEGH